MEKWKKRYIVITAIIFAITCVATVLFAYNVNQLSIGMVEVIKTILSSLFLLIAVAMIVYFVIGRWRASQAAEPRENLRKSD